MEEIVYLGTKFDWSKTHIDIPFGYTSIGDEAFADCSSLKSITIPDSVTSIGDYAFFYCSSLQSITIPDSVTSIGVDAFAYCSNLKEFNVSPSNKMYKATEDKRCLLDKDGMLVAFAPAGLESYVIPDSVKSIGWGAFTGCFSLQSITIPDSVTSIGNWAFYGCSSLKKFNVSPSNKMYKATEDKRCLLDKDGMLVAFAPAGLESYVIPDSVKSIGWVAFTGCSSLQSITIPEGVTSIGGCAFYGCSSLQSIMIPDSVTSIGRYAFSNCSSLKSITIPDSVTSIGEGAFYECSKLETVRIPKHLTEEAGWEERIFGDMLPENIEIYYKVKVKTDEGLSK